MITWLSTHTPPAERTETWVKLPRGAPVLAEYSPVTQTWLTNTGAVVWPTHYQTVVNLKPPSARMPDWLTCTAEQFIGHWLAGWETGRIARPGK